MAKCGGGRAVVQVFFILMILCGIYVFYAGVVSSPWKRFQPLISWESIREKLTQELFFPESPTPWLRNIFFVETSCALLGFPNHTSETDASTGLYGGLRMSPRVACSIAAAARTHPRRPVYFVHTCPLDAVGVWESAPSYALEVLEMPNVRVWDVRLAALLRRSPLEALLGEGKLSASEWPRPHASDVMRVLLLTRFGGTYLDTDVVLLRSLGDMKNFSPLETVDSVNNAVMDLDFDTVGREVGQECLKEMGNYNPHNWAYNGPALMTRVLKRRCKIRTTKFINYSREKCGGFNILPQSSFYPIDYNHWLSFFEEEQASSVMKMINKSYGVHIWSHFDDIQSHKVLLSSMQPYAQIARSACPNVVEALGDEM